MNEWAFRNLFRGTSIQRVGRTRFLRNLAVALGNWGEDAAIAGLLQLLGEPEALIRGAAVWSLRQIVHKQELRGTRAQAVLALEKTLIKEQDPIVLEEFWP
ncbi:MAG TPA: hypothetical protein HPQ00_17075 [Magnetococcales bacterium]|nr:hypothetical protein [Magnetococcales bacterium]